MEAAAQSASSPSSTRARRRARRPCAGPRRRTRRRRRSRAVAHRDRVPRPRARGTARRPRAGPRRAGRAATFDGPAPADRAAAAGGGRARRGTSAEHALRSMLAAQQVLTCARRPPAGADLAQIPGHRGPTTAAASSSRAPPPRRRAPLPVNSGCRPARSPKRARAHGDGAAGGVGGDPGAVARAAAATAGRGLELKPRRPGGPRKRGRAAASSRASSRGFIHTMRGRTHGADRSPESTHP